MFFNAQSTAKVISEVIQDQKKDSDKETTRKGRDSYRKSLKRRDGYAVHTASTTFSETDVNWSDKTRRRLSIFTPEVGLSVS